LNGGHIVIILCTAIAAVLASVLGLAAALVPSLETQTAFAIGLPFIIGVAILIPAFRSRMK